MEQTYNIVFKVPQLPERATPQNAEQQIVDQANGFFQAGSRCEADICLSPNVTNSLVAPAVVCFAFAAELYLKLLLRFASIDPGRVHDLSGLFNLLPPETKAIVVERFQQPEGELERQIELASRAFVEWRYAHELPQGSISPSSLKQIGRALHQTARRIRPDLLVTFENRLALPPNYVP